MTCSAFFFLPNPRARMFASKTKQTQALRLIPETCPAADPVARTPNTGIVQALSPVYPWTVMGTAALRL